MAGRVVRGLGMAALMALPAPLLAQQPAAPPAEKRQELDALRGTLSQSKEAEAKIRAEIDAIAEERTKLNQELMQTVDRSRTIETRMAASEGRLKGLGDNERGLKTQLDARRATIAELLAALQRVGRQPPPAFLVRPDDALGSVRSAMLLGSVLPEIRSEADALAADLAQLERVRRDIGSEREQLARDKADFEASRQRLTLLIEARQQRQREREQALAEERRKIESLGRNVASLEELIGRSEREIESARRAAESAARAPTAAPSGTQGTRQAMLAALNDPSRISPAVPFASARGLLPLPVQGVRVKTFGDDDGFGGSAKGVSLSTRPGAPVTAPCDGWVMFAGPFRSYGQLLILNAGGGYHVLLAGMEKISVEVGQFVLTGEPVAEMGGGGAKVASAVNPGLSQPILYVEFRKDNQSIDPGPWWAQGGAEKVRG